MSEGEDELVMLLEVYFQGEYAVQLIKYHAGHILTVADIRKQLAQEYGLEEEPSYATTWLVYRGRKLEDTEQVTKIGLEDYSRVIFGVSAKRPSFHASPSIGTVNNTTNGGINVMSGSGVHSTSSDGSDRSFKIGNDGGGKPSPTNSYQEVLTNVLASNPDLLLEMLSANPRMKALFERNPHLRHALSDPDTLKDLIQLQSDPRRLQETMRGHDRALANIQNLPGGFQALQQFMLRDMADMEEGLASLSMVSEEPWEQSVKNQSTSPKGNPLAEPKKQRVTQPMPNPWRKNPPSSSSNITIGRKANDLNEINMDGDDNSGIDDEDRFIDNSQLNVDDKSSNWMEFEGRFHSQLQMMRDMGFTDTRANIRALLATGGNVSNAIERLISQEKPRDYKYNSCDRSSSSSSEK